MLTRPELAHSDFQGSDRLRGHRRRVASIDTIPKSICERGSKCKAKSILSTYRSEIILSSAYIYLVQLLLLQLLFQ